MLERARGECLRGAAAERGEGSVRPQRSEAGQQVGIGSAGGVGSQARVGTRRISVAFSLVRGTDALLDVGFRRSPTLLLAIYSSYSRCAPQLWPVGSPPLEMPGLGAVKRPRPSGVWSRVTALACVLCTVQYYTSICCSRASLSLKVAWCSLDISLTFTGSNDNTCVNRLR
jgi:hypothetical protein